MAIKSNLLFVLLISQLGFSCSKPSVSLTLNDEDTVFRQSGVLSKRKLDMLWVIDNSNSMATSQTKIAENFNQFIGAFTEKNYDFQLAVTTTEAWLAPFDSAPALSRYRDGTDLNGYSGVPVVTAETPNLVSTFVTNVLQGILGYGDERAFQSMLYALNDSQNSGFLREKAFLAIIIVSDEDDFSHDGQIFLGNNYQAPQLHSIDQYVGQLDQLKGRENYSVSAMSITDQNCLSSLQSEFPGRRIGQRYIELANLSGGIVASLCDDFSATFDIISDSIIELTSEFVLEREPNIDTIRVLFDNTPIENNAENGWQYEPEGMTIKFFGNAIPTQGQQVNITYDPIGVKE